MFTRAISERGISILKLKFPYFYDIIYIENRKGENLWKVGLIKLDI